MYKDIEGFMRMLKIATGFVMLLALLSLSGPASFAIEFNKPCGDLAYWYNYYYDPEFLQREYDSLMSLKSQVQPDGSISIAPVDDQLFLFQIRSRDPVSQLDGVPYVLRYIRHDGDTSAIRSAGVEFWPPVGPEALPGRFPLNKLPDVLALPTVKSISSGTCVFETHLDVSRGEVRADTVNQKLGYTGKDVVVGIIAAHGIDIYSDDFRDSFGNSRIQYLWDQNTISGPSPPDLEFVVGTEWSKHQIDSLLVGLGSLAIDTGSGHHGSMVASVAAGNGRQTSQGYQVGTFTGIAPESDLVVAHIGVDLVNGYAQWDHKRSRARERVE